MRRSVKYGLYGAVLAGVVGGTAAFATSANGTPVTLVVDGHSKKIDTSASNVARRPEERRLPRRSARPRRPVAARASSTTAPRSSSSAAGCCTSTSTAAARTCGPPSRPWPRRWPHSATRRRTSCRCRARKRLPLSATAIALRTPKTVTVVHDHKRTVIVTTAPTVGAAAEASSASQVGADDRVQPGRATRAHARA